MKAYILSEADFERLRLALREVPPNGVGVMSEAEKRAYDDMYRRFNFIVHRWEDEAKR